MSYKIPADLDAVLAEAAEVAAQDVENANTAGIIHTGDESRAQAQAMLGRGRPPKNGDTGSNLTVRVAPSMRASIDTAAQAAGMTTSDWVRCILSHAIETDTDAQAVKALAEAKHAVIVAAENFAKMSLAYSRPASLSKPVQR